MTTDSHVSRRVATYLDDLARMLSGIDPTLRAQVLAGVREHVDSALADRPVPLSERDVDAVLAELGPPEEVAAASLESVPGIGAGGTEMAGGDMATSQRPALSGRWVPATVGLLTLVTVSVHLLLAGSFLAATTASVAGQAADAQAPGAAFHMPAVYDLVFASVGLLVLTVVPWLVSTILLVASPLWTRREKYAGALLLPFVLAVGLLAPVAASVLAPSDAANRPVLIVTLLAPWALGVTATVVVVRRLWRSGARRARV